MNQIPEKLTNYAAYLEGDQRLGTVDVELPALEAMTETVTGSGIAGELDMPTIGHYAAMTAKLNFRTLDVPSIRLSKQKVHALDFRGSQQVLNAGTGLYEHQAVKVSLRAVPKTTEAGKFEVGTPTETANEFEVTYMKIEINGKKQLEIDKLNFIAFIDGEDQLEQVRKNMGM